MGNLDSHPVLTPKNMGQIEKLAQIGLGRALSVAWQPEMILAAYTTGIAHYDPNTLEQVGFIRLPVSLAEQEVRFSPDGSVLATGHNFFEGSSSALAHTSKVFIWNPKTGQILRRMGRELPGHGNFSLSHQASRLLTYCPCTSEPIQLWEGESPEPIFEYKAPNGSPIQKAIMDTTGQLLGLVLQNQPDRLLVFSIETKQLLYKIKENEKIRKVLFSPDRKLVAYWSESMIALYDLSSREPSALLYPGELCFSPDAQKNGLERWNQDPDT